MLWLTAILLNGVALGTVWRLARARASAGWWRATFALAAAGAAAGLWCGFLDYERSPTVRAVGFPFAAAILERIPGERDDQIVWRDHIAPLPALWVALNADFFAALALLPIGAAFLIRSLIGRRGISPRIED